MKGELKLDSITVIKALTIRGNSLKKLYKVLSENCIKSVSYTESNVLKNDLEVNINGVIFTGKDDKSGIVINSSDRNYTKEELIALQKIVINCVTYPFGGLEFSFGLNIFRNNKTEKIIIALLNKYKIEPLIENLDSEGRIELKISNVKDFTSPSFIDLILELQTLTDLINKK